MIETYTLTFGRYPDGYKLRRGDRFVDVNVNDPLVSPRHCLAIVYDMRTPEIVTIEDVSPPGKGTYIRRRGATLWQPINAGRILEYGDAIRIGNTIIPHSASQPAYRYDQPTQPNPFAAR